MEGTNAYFKLHSYFARYIKYKLLTSLTTKLSTLTTKLATLTTKQSCLD